MLCGQGDVHGVDAAGRGLHRCRAVADRREGPHGPVARCDEETEVSAAGATISAVNVPVPSRSRTKAPPTGSPSPVTTLPVMAVSLPRSTPAGMVWVCVDAALMCLFPAVRYLPSSIGTPTSEPYSVQLPS